MKLVGPVPGGASLDLLFKCDLFFEISCNKRISSWVNSSAAVVNNLSILPKIVEAVRVSIVRPLGLVGAWGLFDFSEALLRVFCIKICSMRLTTNERIHCEFRPKLQLIVSRSCSCRLRCLWRGREYFAVWYSCKMFNKQNWWKCRVYICQLIFRFSYLRIAFRIIKNAFKLNLLSSITIVSRVLLVCNTFPSATAKLNPPPFCDIFKYLIVAFVIMENRRKCTRPCLREDFGEPTRDKDSTGEFSPMRAARVSIALILSAVFFSEKFLSNERDRNFLVPEGVNWCTL